MKVSSISICLLGASLCAQLAVASEDFRIIGSRQVEVRIHNHSPHVLGEGPRATTKKIISLQRIRLSGAAQKNLLLALDQPTQTKTHTAQAAHNAPEIPAKVDLGMNGLPVLDQGIHGTCTTFSNTAAVDAAVSGKDTISQLCLLQLGKTLNLLNPEEPTGWDGEDGPVVLERLQQYGAIDKDFETKTGCGGLHHYPFVRARTGDAMSVDDYAHGSKPVMDAVTWQSLLTGAQFNAKNIDKTKLLQTLKAKLAAGHRLTMGFLVADVPENGAQGTYHEDNDSWVITPDVSYQIKARCKGKTSCDIDAHEVVVIGYDDDITISGNKGAFILRNSWGIDAGDEGNFYLSYDYFKSLSDEVQDIAAN